MNILSPRRTAMEATVLIWIAAVFGATGMAMRLFRAYGEELLEFAKWLRAFVDQMRALWR